jgi:hypothetical protein
MSIISYAAETVLYPTRLLCGETENLFPQLPRFNFGLPVGAERGRDVCLCIISCCTGEISPSFNDIVLGESSLNDLDYDPSPSHFKICFEQLHSCIARRDCFSLDIILQRSVLVDFFTLHHPPIQDFGWPICLSQLRRIAFRLVLYSRLRKNGSR